MPKFIYSSIHLFIYSSIHLFIHSSIHLFIYSTIHLFSNSSIHLFYSSIHLFIYSPLAPYVSIPSQYKCILNRAYLLSRTPRCKHSYKFSSDISQQSVAKCCIMLFSSHLNYCSIILSSASSSMLKKLITLQKRAVRTIKGADFRAHC